MKHIAISITIILALSSCQSITTHDAYPIVRAAVKYKTGVDLDEVLHRK